MEDTPLIQEGVEVARKEGEKNGVLHILLPETDYPIWRANLALRLLLEGSESFDGWDSEVIPGQLD